MLSPHDLYFPSLPEKLAIAVSGGADSMAMALLLAELATRKQIRLFALTVDHGLRPEAAQEAAQVGRWMADHAIPHETLQWNLQEKPSANIQAKAREARYLLMADWCKKHDITHLCTAHHLDDQAETFLIRLQRGSGIDGLSSMQPASRQFGITVLRPLLSIRKQALIEYLTDREQPWIEDPSNHAEYYTRTRIRHLLPTLETAGISAETLARTAEHMTRARGYLEQQTAKAFTECITIIGGKKVLALPAFEILHPEIALRVLADLLQQISEAPYRPRFNDLHRLYLALLAREKARTLQHCQFRLKKGDTFEVTCETQAAPLKQDETKPI